MTANVPTLYLISGKIAAGKSTLAERLAEPPSTILLSEDHLLATLYPDEVFTLEDFIRCSRRVRKAVEPHVIALLKEGISVVMDFAANTPKQRQWMRSLFEEAGVRHELHYLDVPDAVCKARLRERNASGDHAFQTNDAEFDMITAHFVPPAADEGFNVIVQQDG